MITLKSINTFILCSILISGVTNYHMFGTDEEAAPLIQNEDRPTRRSYSMLKKAGKILLSLAIIGSVGFGGYELLKPESPSTALQLKSPFMSLHSSALDVCPYLAPLNAPAYNCSSDDSLQLTDGVHMAESIHSGLPIPECIAQEDELFSSLKKPKVFVSVANAKGLKPLLDEMREQGVAYFQSGWAYGFGGEITYLYYMYESEHFELPSQHFTVQEMDADPEAIKVMQDFLEFSNDFNGIYNCYKFRFVEGNSVPKRISKKKQQHKLRHKNKRQKRST